MATDLLEMWGWCFIPALVTLALLSILYMFIAKFYTFAKARYKGFESKAILYNKSRSVHSGKKTYRYFSVKYALKIDNIYASYDLTFEIGSWFYDDYNINDIINIKYLLSTYKDRKSGTIRKYPHGVNLKESVDSGSEFVCECIKIFIIFSALGFIVCGIYYLTADTYFGPVFTFINSLILLLFFRYICCPILCTGKLNAPCSNEQDENEQKLGIIITEHEYNEFFENIPLKTNECPGGHGLSKFNTPEKGYRCNGCAKDGICEGEEMWGCRTCNYDLCKNCYDSNSKYDGTNDGEHEAPPAYDTTIDVQSPAP